MRRLLAVVAAAALFAQSTGAASLPAALTRFPAAFPPPAARLAAFPPARAGAAAAPARRAGTEPGRLAAWLASAKVVAAALAGAAVEAFAPAPPPPAPAGPAPVPVNLIAALPGAAAPEPGPARDRMLIVMEKGVRVEAVLGRGNGDFSARPAGAANAPFPSLPAFREPWVERDGLRARLTYRRPHGTVTGGADGYRAVFANGVERFAPVKGLPAPFLRAFPIYFRAERIEIEVTVVNRTDRTLRGVRVSAVQETFRPVGTEGMRLSPPTETFVAKELAPGARATARWSTVLSAAAPGAAVNLEQTHLEVRAGADASAAPLLDAPQAGVIDPPGPGLL